MVPALPEDLDHVGQVVLALGVLGGDARQGRPEAAVEAVRAGADLADGALLGRGVAMLHDGHRQAALADHPAVAGGIVELGGEEGRRRARLPVALDEAAERRLGQERHVAGQDQDGVAVVATGLPGLEHRVAGTPALALLDEGGLGLAAHGGADVVRPPSDDHDHAGAEGAGKIDRIVDERPAAELVKRLGTPGAHAGRLAGSENDGSELVHGGQTSSTRHARACPSPTCPEWRALRGVPGALVNPIDCEDDTGPPQFCREEETKTRRALPSPGGRRRARRHGAPPRRVPTRGP